MSATKSNMRCPVCDKYDIVRHCKLEESPQCNWWRCKSCNSFGSSKDRFVDARR